MTRAEIETLLRNALHTIAPEIDPDTIDHSQDLRDECDIDSLDFLNLVTALGKAAGKEMPEADYPKMRSYDALLSYLAT